MGLITISTPVTLTTDQAKAKLLTKTTSKINLLYRQMLLTYQSVMGEIWTNSDGLTPQQAIDAFGTNGGSLANYGNLLAGLINDVNPGTVDATPPQTLTVNPDGTVNVGSTVPSSSSSDSYSSSSSESSSSESYISGQ